MNTSYTAAPPAETGVPQTAEPFDQIISKPIGDRLSAAERNDFDSLDRAIRRQVQGFKELGLYLDEVRQRRLYRDRYGTFEAYLEDVGLKRQRAYELIQAATAAASVSEISDIRVERESHAAALAEVPMQDRPAVLKVAAESTGGRITAKEIRNCARRMKYKPKSLSVTSNDTSRCELAPDGKHTWDEDQDAQYCTICKEDYDPAIHGPVDGDAKYGDAEYGLPPQPRWFEAAGEIVAALQAKNTSENRHRATSFIWKLVGLLDDLESGRLPLSVLRQTPLSSVEAGQ